MRCWSTWKPSSGNGADTGFCRSEKTVELEAKERMMTEDYLSRLLWDESRVIRLKPADNAVAYELGDGYYRETELPIEPADGVYVVKTAVDGVILPPARLTRKRWYLCRCPAGHWKTVRRALQFHDELKDRRWRLMNCVRVYEYGRGEYPDPAQEYRLTPAEPDSGKPSEQELDGLLRAGEEERLRELAEGDEKTARRIAARREKALFDENRKAALEEQAKSRQDEELFEDIPFD